MDLGTMKLQTISKHSTTTRRTRNKHTQIRYLKSMSTFPSHSLEQFFYLEYQ